MWKMFKKAFIIAIAIVVVQWAWRHLQKDGTADELAAKIRKIIYGQE